MSAAFTFHWYVNPVPVLALSVTVLPAQRLVLPPAVIDAGGGDVTVTSKLFDVVLPQLFVTEQL
jgi:hypothetical protein